ncbi:MAG: hypothetical protein ACRDGE_05350, partial [Candidatus Limnocylindria bacterium]
AAVGLVAAPRPPAATPTPAATDPPAPTPTPDTEPLVFQQPLSAGCATERGVWVFSDGGGIGRYDGERWELVDAVLRSVVAAHCTEDVALGVGPGATLVRADDAARAITGDTLGSEHLYGIAGTGFGIVVAGARGTVMVLTPDGWRAFARGITEDLRDASDGTEGVWVVGVAGAAYRLEERGWVPHPTGTTATLRAVALGPGGAVAVGDGGTILVFDDGWRAIPSETTSTLRAMAVVGGALWLAGDGGTLLRLEGGGVSRRDLGTTCDLRWVFDRRGELWVVGSAPGRAGVWRVGADRVERWGSC